MIGRIAGVVGVVTMSVLTAALGSCGRDVPLSAADVYTVRGVVERLPQAGGPDSGLYIHHAAIPNFRDGHGRVVGMMSMTMPFPVAAGVSLAGIAPGDAVEFTFAVEWKHPTGYEVIRIRKLPAGTAVDFNPH
jgi:Copper binding periplasmic protein CusF